jgi:hypothetical protein
VQNLSVWGGYTWAFLATEHTVMRNCRLLYCWSALGIVGSYFNSVGAGHAIFGDQISVEGCTYNWYVFGQGASGVGPFIDIIQMDTESPAPACRDDGNGGVQFSLGRIKLTGLYTAASISIPMTGLEVIDGQQRPGPVTATAIPTGTTPAAKPALALGERHPRRRHRHGRENRDLHGRGSRAHHDHRLQPILRRAPAVHVAGTARRLDRSRLHGDAHDEQLGPGLATHGAPDRLGGNLRGGAR